MMSILVFSVPLSIGASTYVPTKAFEKLLKIKPTSPILSKIFRSEIEIVVIWFDDQIFKTSKLAPNIFFNSSDPKSNKLGRE